MMMMQEESFFLVCRCNSLSLFYTTSCFDFCVNKLSIWCLLPFVTVLAIVLLLLRCVGHIKSVTDHRTYMLRHAVYEPFGTAV